MRNAGDRMTDQSHPLDLKFTACVENCTSETDCTRRFQTAGGKIKQLMRSNPSYDSMRVMPADNDATLEDLVKDQENAGCNYTPKDIGEIALGLSGNPMPYLEDIPVQRPVRV
jgi:hypothetical protein